MTHLALRTMSRSTAQPRNFTRRVWRKAFTLNEMFEAWSALVTEADRGYDQMVDEYTNDMACRDWIALVWPKLTQRGRDARTEELQALDERL